MLIILFPDGCSLKNFFQQVISRIYHQSPYWFNKPDLVPVSVVSPLDDLLLFLGFSFADIKSFSAPASNVVSWFSTVLVIRAWNELPQFVFFLVWLAAVDLDSIVAGSFRNFHGQVVLGTDDGEPVVSNWDDGELLVASIVPVPEDHLVETIDVLRAVQNHAVIKGSGEFVKEVVLRVEGVHEIKLYCL